MSKGIRILFQPQVFRGHVKFLGVYFFKHYTLNVYVIHVMDLRAQKVQIQQKVTLLDLILKGYRVVVASSLECLTVSEIEF